MLKCYGLYVLNLFKYWLMGKFGLPGCNWGRQYNIIDGPTLHTLRDAICAIRDVSISMIILAYYILYDDAVCIFYSFEGIRNYINKNNITIRKVYFWVEGFKFYRYRLFLIIMPR